MIRKLQIRYIVLALAAIISVLTVILGVVISISFHETTMQADQVLQLLKENDCIFGPESFNNKYFNNRIDGDTPFETRYFVVYYNDEGKIINYNLKQTATSFEEAMSYSNKAYNKVINKAYINDFRYLKYEENGITTIIFMDCSRQLVTIRYFLLSSLFVSMTGILTIFILLFIFSKHILKPIIDSYEKQKKFITNASHELKTPLTVITANMELLSMEYGDNEYTATIDKQVNKLVSMTNNLVMLSKIDEQSSKIEMTNFSLTEACYDICDEYSKTITKTLTLDIEEKVMYTGDERLIRQMLVLLVDNAKKYSKSTILFALHKNKNQVSIQIENDTNGIPKGNLKYFSDRFYRSDESRGQGIDGSGIGLSVVSEIVSLHKGNMKMYSEDGVIFKIEIIL